MRVFTVVNEVQPIWLWLFQVQSKDEINLIKTPIFNIESSEPGVESTQQTSNILDGSGNCQ